MFWGMTYIWTTVLAFILNYLRKTSATRAIDGAVMQADMAWLCHDVMIASVVYWLGGAQYPIPTFLPDQSLSGVA